MRTKKVNISGQEAVEFILITVLVFFGALFTILVFGEKISAFFTRDSSVVKVASQTPSVLNPDSKGKFDPDYETKASEDQDNNENLTVNYNEGTGTLQLGDITLTGVPDDFATYIQTAGSSGGTELLAGLINQIADQLEAEGLTEQSLEVRKLASMGHNLATIENEYEKMMNSCAGDVNCAKNKFLSDTMTKPEGFDESFYDYKEADFKDYVGNMSVGRIMYCRNQGQDCGLYDDSSSTSYSELINNNSPPALFIEQYLKIMDSGINESTKGIIEELYWDIGLISENVESGLSYLEYGQFWQDYHDPITGEMVDSYKDLPSANNFTEEDLFALYKDFYPSTLTHLDSALICASGKHEDSGTACH